MPTRALSDKRLGATDFRVLGIIGQHDRRSLAKGSGAGCFSSMNSLARRLDMDVRQLGRSVDKLVSLGYLERTPRGEKWQGYTFRVIEEGEDSKVPRGEGSAIPTPNKASIDDPSPDCPYVGTDQSSGLGQHGPHNKRAVREPVRDSAEAAHFYQNAPISVDQISVCEDADQSEAVLRNELQHKAKQAKAILGTQKAIADKAGLNGTDIARAISGNSITAEKAQRLDSALNQIIYKAAQADLGQRLGQFAYALPHSFEQLPEAAQLSRLEDVIKGLGRQLDQHEAERVLGYLEEIILNASSNEHAKHAERIADQLATGAYC